MTTGAISFFSDTFDPVMPVGPIFDKELRVSSRRGRNYLLRFAYVALLGAFVISTWYSFVGLNTSGGLAYGMSRLPLAARKAISTIVWFQFITAQLVAVIMLGSSISDEIRTGTLSVLMTTPITSFQIVAGKLLSKLLQVTLLLAISLPFLAIIRVFGGVPWDYVMSSVAVTLTATLLAGALSLLLSMTYRHAYTVILVTIGVYLLLFGAVSGLLNMLAVKGLLAFDVQTTQSLLALTNPFVAFAALNARFLQSGTPSFFSWPLHCLLMLAATSVLIGIAVWRVRQTASVDASASTTRASAAGTLQEMLARIFNKTGSRSASGTIASVTGPPIVWKEMRKGFVGSSKGDAAIFVLLFGAFLIAAALLLTGGRGSFLSSYFMSAFYLVALVRMAVFSAGSITAEKEARTWPVLLATPLEDRDIVRGKAIAAFRRNVPLLLLYFLLLSIFYIKIAGLKSIVAILLNLLPLASSVLFVIGVGSYFGMRFRTTTVAVAATIGSYFAIVFLLCGAFNPLSRFVALGLVARRGGQWLYFGVTMVRCVTIGAAGLAFVRCARRRMRRDIF